MGRKIRGGGVFSDSMVIDVFYWIMIILVVCLSVLTGLYFGGVFNPRPKSVTPPGTGTAVLPPFLGPGGLQKEQLELLDASLTDASTVVVHYTATTQSSTDVALRLIIDGMSTPPQTFSPNIKSAKLTTPSPVNGSQSSIVVKGYLLTGNLPSADEKSIHVDGTK